MSHDAIRLDNPSFRSPSRRGTRNGAEQADRFVDGSQGLVAGRRRASEACFKRIIDSQCDLL